MCIKRSTKTEKCFSFLLPNTHKAMMMLLGDTINIIVQLNKVCQNSPLKSIHCFVSGSFISPNQHIQNLLQVPLSNVRNTGESVNSSSFCSGITFVFPCGVRSADGLGLKVSIYEYESN